MSAGKRRPTSTPAWPAKKAAKKVFRKETLRTIGGVAKTAGETAAYDRCRCCGHRWCHRDDQRRHEAEALGGDPRRVWPAVFFVPSPFRPRRQSSDRAAVGRQDDRFVAEVGQDVEVVVPVQEHLAETGHVVALVLGVDEDDAGLDETLAEVDDADLGGVGGAVGIDSPLKTRPVKTP